MKHRSIQHTVTPPTYRPESCPKKLTESFNKWAKYISEQNKKFNQ